MDPDATLKAIVEAIQDKDYEEAFYSTQELRNWVRKGGFVPKSFKPSIGNTTLSCDVEIWCNLTMRLMKATMRLMKAMSQRSGKSLELKRIQGEEKHNA